MWLVFLVAAAAVVVVAAATSSCGRLKPMAPIPPFVGVKGAVSVSMSEKILLLPLLLLQVAVVVVVGWKLTSVVLRNMLDKHLSSSFLSGLSLSL
jgi:hypothetical protein